MNVELIENPEWTNAPFEMQFTSKECGLIQDPWPHRFKTPWPDDVTDSDKLWKWVNENSIPRYIKKP